MILTTANFRKDKHFEVNVKSELVDSSIEDFVLHTVTFSSEHHGEIKLFLTYDQLVTLAGELLDKGEVAAKVEQELLKRGE